MPEEKFVFDSLQDSETIRDFLTSLTEGFDKRRITLSTGGENIELSPSGLLGFMVKAKKKGGENKLTIKVSWKDAAPTRETGDDILKVS